ncbi:serine kinase [Paracoccaceae bacterium]|nr:serine kinase [Paracoccaceae bacterium]
MAIKIPFNGSLIIHATCVDINGSGVLIVGSSGSGKSSLAINLLALGSKLVADDQCELVKKNNRFSVSKPASLPNSIEIRGIGLVSVPMVVETSLDWVVNMDEAEKERMPTPRFTEIGDFRIPTVFGKDMDDLAPRIYVLVSNALS